MMWNDISPVWQAAFQEAWKAFCAGSVPIGAVLCDAESSIILYEHNRSHEPQTVNRRIAHAEMNLLMRLDTAAYDPKALTLYSTMEPCPMCMGTVLMSNIRRMHYAAADAYCGMTHLLLSEPYYSSKGVCCMYEGGVPEQLQLTVQAYYELRNMEQGAGSLVFERFAAHCPDAAAAAERLYAEKRLDRAAGSRTDISEVCDQILTVLRDVQGTR